jgi:WD repeat-containing protein 61
MKTTSEKKFILDGHKGPVYELLALDQDNFLSAGSDRIVVKWNNSNTKEGNVLAKASDSIYSFHIIKELNRLLIGQGSGGVHVINLDDGIEEKLLQLHTAPVFKVRSFPGLPYVFSLGGDGILHILNFNFDVLHSIRLSEQKLRSIAVDPENNYILIGNGEGMITMLDAKNFHVLKSWQAHMEGFGVNIIHFTPDGKHYLTGSRDAHLHVYDSNDHTLLEKLPAHRAAIYDIAFHKTGKYFATASRDKSIKVWDLNTMKVLQRIDKDAGNGHGYSVNCCIWMDDLLISSGDDRMIIGNEVDLKDGINNNHFPYNF